MPVVKRHIQCHMLDTELHAMDSVVDDSALVFLDSCASKQLFIVTDETNLENFRIIEGAIQLTKKGSQLKSLGVGKKGDWTNITVSHEPRCHQKCRECRQIERPWLWFEFTQRTGYCKSGNW